MSRTVSNGEAAFWVLVLIGFGFYSYWGYVSYENNLPKAKTILEARGYSDMRPITGKASREFRDFSCQMFKNGDKVQKITIYAVKANSLRMVTVCYTDKEMKLYDKQEMPDFPLLISPYSAKSAYENNVKASEAVATYLKTGKY